MINADQSKSLSSSMLYDIGRTVLAIFLLALTAIVHLPVAVKTVLAFLAITVLVLHKHKPEGFTNLETGMICFAVAIGVIGVCSKSSFLYPLNDWVDANCFFTVGKSMMNGKVVYRDLLEQKGPFLYFLHGLAWLISSDTFIGVYFIEVLAATFFLYYIHRAISLFVQSDCSILAIPICALMIYTCSSFCHGDSVEELALPFLAYAMWLGMDAICSKRDITVWEYYLVGLTSGLIFWSKFTVVGFYLGWYLFPAIRYIREKRWKAFHQSIFFILLGVLSATLPFVVYFGIHGAISDWLKVYLFDNLFVYSNVEAQHSTLLDIIWSVLKGTFITAKNNPLIPILSVSALIYFLFRHQTVGLYFMITAAFVLFFSFVGGVYFSYYSFSMNLFLPFGLIPIMNIFLLSKKDDKPFPSKKNYLVPLIAVIVVGLLLTPNRYLFGVNKKEMPQYKFASIIGNDGTATLLNYGFLDGGFYTVTNTIPDCKIFCLLNISSSELLRIQDEYIQQGNLDYIVTRDTQLTSQNYECISVCEFYGEAFDHIYYLYRHV